MNQREQFVILPGFLLICLTCFLACSSLEPGATPQPAKPDQTGEKSNTTESNPNDRQLARILDERLARGDTPSDLFIEAECYEGDDHFRSLQVHGDGFAVWDGEVQFSLGDAEIHRMLETLKKVRFTTFQELYGSSATRIICRVVLEIDGVRKQTAQRRRGDQNLTLKALANHLFDLAREPARTGTRVTSLQEGLEKISRGELDPRALSLILHRKPERTSEMVGENVGWLFRLDGPQTSTQVYTDGSLGESKELELSAIQMIELAGLLAGQNFVDLPENLYSDKYTDMVVGVLKYEARIQARRFAGMTPTTHGESQERFDRVLAAVRDLQRHTAEEGVSSP